jgi:hypothetical protein
MSVNNPNLGKETKRMTMLTPDFSSRPETSGANEVADPITELLRGHARKLIAVALEAQVQLVMNQLRRDGLDVVRNGYPPERDVTTAVGDVAVFRERRPPSDPITSQQHVIGIMFQST